MTSSNTDTPKKKFPFIATILMIAGVIILALLGKWQVERLAWKTDIITNIQKARETRDEHNQLTANELASSPDVQKKSFHVGYIEGEFYNDKEILVGPRVYNGLKGHHIIVPFKMDGGTIILVNRGWVSDDFKEQSKRAQFTRSGPTKVYGMARLPEPANRFTPENKPNQQEWYIVNITQMAAYSGFRENISPYIFYSEKLNKYYQGWPVPHDPTYLPPNNHLGYAIFWFLMIIPLIVIYYLRFWKQNTPAAPRKKD